MSSIYPENFMSSYPEGSALARAWQFALERHVDQKYGNHPYTYHLGMVAALAARLGYSESVVVAAIVHDTVEDTDTTIDEIREFFGDKVAQMVEGVTYTEEDKANGVDKVEKARAANVGAHVVKYCDGGSNLAVTVAEGVSEGKDPWVQTVERYGERFARLQQGLPTPTEVDMWLEAT